MLLLVNMFLPVRLGSVFYKQKKSMQAWTLSSCLLIAEEEGLPAVIPGGDVSIEDNSERVASLLFLFVTTLTQNGIYFCSINWRHQRLFWFGLLQTKKV